jgi:sugar lactone lactonase YvrE
MITPLWERQATALDQVARGLLFPESPRWHAGELWFSDIDAKAVMRIPAGQDEPVVVVRVESKPSGLGWLPDGRLLIVAMQDRRLLRLEADARLSVAGDLSGVAISTCNDMVVDATGRAYVGQFGFDPDADEPRATDLLRVDPDGAVSVAAGGLNFPNGAVVMPDGATLVVAESWTHDLTAFDVDDDGSLSNRRLWAHLEGAAPDGICVDEAGAIWLASPISKEVVRVAEGGEVLGRVSTGERRALACALGGEDGRTLFVCSVGRRREMALGPTGSIDAIEVEVPGAGI